MVATIINASTTTESPPKNGQQTKPLGGGGGLNTYNWCRISALDSVFAKTQILSRSQGSNKHTMMKQRKGHMTRRYM